MHNAQDEYSQRGDPSTLSDRPGHVIVGSQDETDITARTSMDSDIKMTMVFTNWKVKKTTPRSSRSQQRRMYDPVDGTWHDLDKNRSDGGDKMWVTGSISQRNSTGIRKRQRSFKWYYKQDKRGNFFSDIGQFNENREGSPIIQGFSQFHDRKTTYLDRNNTAGRETDGRREVRRYYHQPYIYITRYCAIQSPIMWRMRSSKWSNRGRRMAPTGRTAEDAPDGPVTHGSNENRKYYRGITWIYRTTDRTVAPETAMTMRLIRTPTKRKSMRRTKQNGQWSFFTARRITLEGYCKIDQKLNKALG